MNITGIFGGQKLEVLNAFLAGEVKSYPGLTNLSELRRSGEKPEYKDVKLNERGIEFLEELKQKIADEIEKLCPNGFNWCYINSYGNAGALELQIMIYGKDKFYNWKEPNILINLCTCGNINHWGSIEILDEKKGLIR